VVLLTEQTPEAVEEWFLSLVQHSSDLMVVVDEQTRLVYANPAALEMFGVSADEASGTTAFRFIHPDELERVMVRHVELLQSPGASMLDTLRFVSVTGEVRILETVTTNCLHVASVAGLVINGRDITERDEYVRTLEASFESVTVALANAVELRDPYTAGHQREVAGLATAIAGALALPDDDIKGIKVAATLHDIGKIAVPAEILTRPGRLSPAEFEIIKTHPDAGYGIVAEVSFPWPVAEMIRQHHERLDGSGYPRGLCGSAILMGARIIAVADVISATSAYRPYRPARGLGAALAELEANSGRLYDSRVVDASLRLLGGQHNPVLRSTG
jgi:PAS domain S-box-containing protein/putative nucleotidyltransferase with HDIG domain